MSGLLPQRLNLAVARGCFVKCVGCYSLFGRAEPDLDAIAGSAASLARLGIDALTLSGGDPLTLPGLLPFLRRLRAAGFRSIKLDTVGTALLPGPGLAVDRARLRGLAQLVDTIGVPLDGASNADVAGFRRGRPALFDEMLALLGALQDEAAFQRVVINTVVHRGNLTGLRAILACIKKFDVVNDWSLFQYTASDQADDLTNAAMRISDAEFAAACEALRYRLTHAHAVGRVLPHVQFRSAASRLGDYLLVNSDGEAWLPDEHGNTLHLGNLIDGEAEVVERWRTHATRLLGLKTLLPDWTPGTPPTARRAGA